MRRRDMILGTLVGLGLPFVHGGSVPAAARTVDPEGWEKSVRNFPFRLFETSGADALSAWERLKRRGEGYPVVIGAAEDVIRLSERLAAPTKGDGTAESEPRDWNAIMERSCCRDGPPVGHWPDEIPESPHLSVALDMCTCMPRDTVYLTLVPANDDIAVHAMLRPGGGDVDGQASLRTAALRSWKTRYGAEIVGGSADAINIRIRRRPQTRDEALALAREQYEFCPDIIEKCVGDLSPLAAMLMEEDWWYFWWD